MCGFQCPVSNVQKLGACNFFGGHWTLDKDPDFGPAQGGYSVTMVNSWKSFPHEASLTIQDFSHILQQTPQDVLVLCSKKIARRPNWKEFFWKLFGKDLLLFLQKNIFFGEKIYFPKTKVNSYQETTLNMETKPLIPLTLQYCFFSKKFLHTPKHYGRPKRVVKR